MGQSKVYIPRVSKLLCPLVYYDKDFSTLHSQKKQLNPLYIFISASIELSLYSWIACLGDDIQLIELFLLRVC